MIDENEAEELTQGIGQIHAGGWRVVASLIRLGIPKILGLSNEEWVKQRIGGTVRMSIEERREAVAELDAEGMSQREIGDTLGVDHRTVGNDLKTGENSPVDAETPSLQPELGENSPPETPNSLPDPEMDEDTADLLADLLLYAPLTEYRAQIEGVVSELYEYANTFPTIAAPMPQEMYVTFLKCVDKAEIALTILKRTVEQEVQEKGLMYDNT
jgi:hypothetical protein